MGLDIYKDQIAQQMKINSLCIRLLLLQFCHQLRQDHCEARLGMCLQRFWMLRGPMGFSLNSVQAIVQANVPQRCNIWDARRRYSPIPWLQTFQAPTPELLAQDPWYTIMSLHICQRDRYQKVSYFGYCSVAAIGSPIWAAAARTLALFAATASKCEIIGRNFTWRIAR